MFQKGVLSTLDHQSPPKQTTYPVSVLLQADLK